MAVPTEVVYPSTQFRLRAASPMPTGIIGAFILHTFGAEKSKIELVSCTTTLPASTEFRGQGGTLMSASFTQLPIKDGGVFSGKRVHAPEFIQEDEMSEI